MEASVFGKIQVAFFLQALDSTFKATRLVLGSDFDIWTPQAWNVLIRALATDPRRLWIMRLRAR
jgi:hypothetical protein